jgi:hypothetical protein
MCGAARTVATTDAWIFIATQQGAVLVCSRQCLIRFAVALPLPHGDGFHVITPHRRE